MGYIENITTDFKDMYDLLQSQTDNKLTIFNDNEELYKLLEKYHQKIYILKDITKDSTYYEEAIYDFINFIWLIYIADYSSAISNYRNGLDKFARNLIESLDDTCLTDSFSNNLEKSLSIYRKSKSFTGKTEKAHKKFLNEKLGNLIKKHYYKLSDIVHGKKKIISGISNYLEEILNHQKKQDKELSLQILKLANSNIRLICIVILIIDKNNILYHNNNLRYENWKEILGEEIVEYNINFGD